MKFTISLIAGYLQKGFAMPAEETTAATKTKEALEVQRSDRFAPRDTQMEVNRYDSWYIGRGVTI